MTIDALEVIQSQLNWSNFNQSMASLKVWVEKTDMDVIKVTAPESLADWNSHGPCARGLKFPHCTAWR